MIDDKEIDIAARAQALSKHINETAYFQLRSIEDFKDGARWAINEVLKDLWHPASEEPDKHRICLVRVVYHLNYGMLPDEERIEQSSFHDFGWYDYDFKYIGVDYDIVSYLYVDELLPKKGGNHD